MNAVNAGKIFLKSTLMVTGISGDASSDDRSTSNVGYNRLVGCGRRIDQIDSNTDGSK